MSLILAEETVNTLTDVLSYITISGGTLISGGGQQGGSSGSLGTGSTHYKAWSGTLSYTAGRYYSIVCGDNILTWLMPVSHEQLPAHTHAVGTQQSIKSAILSDSHITNNG